MLTVPETLLERMGFLIENYSPLILEGIYYTLLLSVVGTFIGILIGSVLVMMRTQEIHYKDSTFKRLLKKVLRIIAQVYIDIVRGTPMIVQAALFFYGMAYIGYPLNPITAGLIIVAFNTASYIAEILRSGINALDKGQMEAARSLGMSRGLAMKKIILPQVYKNSLPSLMNELIVNIKDSSVLSTIGVTELFYMTKGAASEYYLYFEAMLLAAIIYLFLTTTLSRFFNFLVHRKNKNKDYSFPSSQTVPEVEL